MPEYMRQNQGTGVAYREALDVVDKNTKTPEGKKLIIGLKEAIIAEKAINEKLISLAMAGDDSHSSY